MVKVVVFSFIDDLFVIGDVEGCCYCWRFNEVKFVYLFCYEFVVLYIVFFVDGVVFGMSGISGIVNIVDVMSL